MRIFADENISRNVVERLRTDGHDVIWVSQSAPGLPDARVLEMAQNAGLILLTEDTDFGELVIRRRLPADAVVLLELDKLSNQAEADRVSEVLAKHGSAVSGNLVIVQPARLRIRPLPR